MQAQSRSQYLKACNEYFEVLNKVNLLLVKEHTYLSEKEQYEQEITIIDGYINQLLSKKQRGTQLPVQRQHQFLQSIIGQNKAELQTLRRKLDTKQALISELNSLRQTQQKYLKLLSSQYQSSLQQKLSMIRGKVDDLKKKIKEINKEVLSLQQQHKQIVDDYSYRCNCLNDQRLKNDSIRKQIQELKIKLNNAKEKRK